MQEFLKNNKLSIILIIILVAYFLFNKNVIKKHEEEIIEKNKIISELNINIKDLSNKKTNNNIKTITYINKDGSKKIEQIDLSTIEDNKNIDTKINEKTEKESEKITKIKDLEIVNPKTIFLGIGLDNDLNKKIHLNIIKNSVEFGIYTSHNFNKFGGFIGIGF